MKFSFIGVGYWVFVVGLANCAAKHLIGAGRQLGRNRGSGPLIYDPSTHHAGLSKHDDSATGFMDYSKYGYANFRKDYAYERYPSFYSPCSERDN